MEHYADVWVDDVRLSSSGKLMFLPFCPCRCLAGNRSEGSLYRCTAGLGWDARDPGDKDTK